MQALGASDLILMNISRLSIGYRANTDFMAHENNGKVVFGTDARY